eukprot:c18745_g1_i3 orf=130-336(-)
MRGSSVWSVLTSMTLAFWHINHQSTMGTQSFEYHHHFLAFSKVCASSTTSSATKELCVVGSASGFKEP